ncbi:MAG: phospholipase D-like domain-containing protein [Candidatus Eisenbacteria bacterium]|nr:phospholipase D-like domain-containing protein [Candidatus Eisenbacteria bacterium]
MKTRLIILAFVLQALVLPGLVSAAAVDLSGWKVVQANSDQTYTIPNGTAIPGKGYVIVARNATQAQFETFWGVTLGPNVVFLNTGDATGVAPKINGDETFTLKNASLVVIDGPTVAMAPYGTAGQSIRRNNPGDPAGVEASWTRGPDRATGNPGSGAGTLSNAGVRINEFSDALGTGNFVYEFVELFNDDGTGTSGDGTGSAAISPRYRVVSSSGSEKVSIAGDGTYTLANVAVIVPTGWGFSRSLSDVAISGSGFASATPSVSGDTIKVTGAAVTASDSGHVTILNLTAPSSPATATFVVKTAVSGGTLTSIAGSPTVLVIGGLIPISNLHQNDSQGIPAAPYLKGTSWTVTGVVTVGSGTLGTYKTHIFIQDATGGIAFYSSDSTLVFVPGDSITLAGTVDQYRGLTELVPIMEMRTIHGSGFPGPAPLVLTCAQVATSFYPDYTEPNESRLVRVNRVTYDPVTHILTDSTGTTSLYIAAATGIPAPTGTFDVIGILSQYTGYNPPYTSGYEIIPRYPSDIIYPAGPMFTSVPVETLMTATSVTIKWDTDVASTSEVHYGLTQAYELGSVTDTAHVMHHMVTLYGLRSGTIYNSRSFSSSAQGTNSSGNLIFSSASAPTSTGAMNVYFTKSVDVSCASGEQAWGNVDIPARLILRINAASYSIDCCVYNLLLTNISDALVAAKNRGVKVRVIVEYDNSTSSQIQSLIANGIPVITDRYGSNSGSGAMHNKFYLFDARDTSSYADDMIWTGSWNASSTASYSNMENAMEIWDQALANAYTAEFNEMWGSSGDTPNPTNSRTGAAKSNNTPHRFMIAGQDVRCYFSPSDAVNSRLIETINTADYSVYFSILAFTRWDIQAALKAKWMSNPQIPVRGVFDSGQDCGGMYYVMRCALCGGLPPDECWDPVGDVLLDGESGTLHHKYLIVDGNCPDSKPWLETGSYNWSVSGTTANDENVVIIQSARVANLYLQEFKARYAAAGGTANPCEQCVIGAPVSTDRYKNPEGFSLSQNVPNPFNPVTTIEFNVAKKANVSLRIYDVSGRLVRVLVDKNLQPGVHKVNWDGRDGKGRRLPSGIYLYRLTAGKEELSKRMVFIR